MAKYPYRVRKYIEKEGGPVNEFTKSFTHKHMYQCSMCKEVYKKGLTDEEAREQYKREFAGRPDLKGDEPLVCDDCYKTMESLYPAKVALNEMKIEKILRE